MATSVLPIPNSIIPTPSSSAGGLISYLAEPDNVLKVRALQKLYSIIDLHWVEVCDSITLIEELSEDSSFPAADLAAALASKCFYHLQEYSDSLRLALSAGKYFDISQKNEYINTLLATCIDEYKSIRIQNELERDVSKHIPIDPRIEDILEQMFQRCYKDLCFEQAIGIALDTRRLDKVQETFDEAIKCHKESILNYTYNVCQNSRSITSREFRLSVMNILVKSYKSLAEPDYVNMCFGFQYLNRSEEVANVFEHLLQSSLDKELMAYQIAFHLLETGDQGFILRVMSEFSSLPAISTVTTNASSSASSSSSTMDTSDPSSTEVTPEILLDRINKLKKILIDGFDIDLVLNFLFKQSRFDVSVLNTIKQSIEGRSNVLHNACVVAHSYMNAGTTKDNFLRDNLDWLGKASNWSKFTAVGSIGVVHKGHVHESMNLLSPYLPQIGSTNSSPYSESGALYALGLIHANKGGSGDSTTISYLLDALRNSGNNEVIQHGACLGIGLAGMATANEALYEAVNQVLFTDSAIASEGAAYGLGLLMVGQSESILAQTNIPTLLNYAHNTSHEKINRALSLAIAMMVYGKEETGDVIIEQLTRDRDPIIRYGGMFAIALAYVGTSDNNAIKKLLHIAVSDVNDDVRRSAVIAIGLVSFQNYESVPKLVALLAESFNPHVRYGACLAVGIACAGTGLKDAIDLVYPMLTDPIDYVRSGALLSMAFILQQVSEARSPSVKKFHELLLSTINDKHQSNVTKSGAILAYGILYAGGKNVNLNLSSRMGFLKMSNIIGLVMFLQYWYWYPLQLFLCLSFTPTMLIGLNKDFQLPNNFEVVCHAPLSMFDYNKLEEKKDEEKKFVATAVLSTTAKAKVREARKEAKKLGKPLGSASIASGTSIQSPSKDQFDIVPMEHVASHLSTVSYLSIEEKVVEEPKIVKKEREPTTFNLTNPARLIPAQLRFITVSYNQRYVPVYKRTIPSGIVMLIDNDPTAPEDVTKVERVALGEGDEAEAPEPFIWDPNEPQE